MRWHVRALGNKNSQSRTPISNGQHRCSLVAPFGGEEVGDMLDACDSRILFRRVVVFGPVRSVSRNAVTSYRFRLSRNERPNSLCGLCTQTTLASPNFRGRFVITVPAGRVRLSFRCIRSKRWNGTRAGLEFPRSGVAPQLGRLIGSGSANGTLFQTDLIHVSCSCIMTSTCGTTFTFEKGEIMATVLRLLYGL